MKDTRYWRQIMEAESEEDIPENPGEVDESSALPEVVYPYNLTEQMLQDYVDPAYNRRYSVDVYREIIVKLLRSAKYWRMDIPKWLPGRLRSLGVL